MDRSDEPGAAKINGAGACDKKTGSDGRIVWGWPVYMHAIESVDGKQGQSIQREVGEPDCGRERMLSGVPGEDHASQQIAVDDDDVQYLRWHPVFRIEDVGTGFNESYQETE